MELNSLSAISPIDGRYRNKTASLSQYFSEWGLIKYRVKIEIEYFITLCNYGIEEVAGVDKGVFPKLRSIVSDFSEKDAAHIKEIEKTTNHDVKAVEYFIKEKFDELGIGEYKEFIHFGLTSQDINNTAIPLSIKDAGEEVVFGLFEELLADLDKLAGEWENVPMLAKTHGQPASPTRLGKELNVFKERLSVQLEMLKEIPYGAKFGGATGNFNAHFVAYPKKDWHQFAADFLSGLGLKRSYPTTQIEHYDL